MSVIPGAAAGRLSMLSRGLSILECFTPGESSLTLSEISRRTGLAKATVHRLIMELLVWGLLDRDGKDLCLGRRVAILSDRVPEPTRLIHRILPHTPLFIARRECPAFFTLLSNGRSLHFEAREGRRVQEDDVAFGAPLAVCVSAAAKVITAFRTWVRPDGIRQDSRRRERVASLPYRGEAGLSKIVHQGYAMTRTGRTVAVAVPISDPYGSILGALSVAIPPGGAHRTAVVRELMGAREALSSVSVHSATEKTA
ncbi:helix-turn-helix domain-containing protein [Streptomyces sp. MP131-18]|uniref:helix-turn-helix domain-containing protein n=1 Tax=Streptomyces sp. MP131-18 TaxID=1857892 RepID=UPI0015C54339|nr:helix-turn-helix domain-containing protein [Streptomyces sp. MP131-18]